MFVPASKVDIAVVSDDPHQNLVSSYTRSAKRQSRSVKLKVSSGGDRVVAKSVCGQIDLGPLGSTVHRSFRHNRQSQATDFRVPISQWDGMAWATDAMCYEV